jgi:hypothetical protein
MNHILKKRAIAGAGGGNEPKPPVYKPPELGDLQYGASHSFAETIDLISDGPIEGIVDREGRVLEGLRILQGIYLDDTPVAVSNNPTDLSISDVEIEALEVLNCELANGNNTATKNCQKFFEELSNANLRSSSARVSGLPRTVGNNLNKGLNAFEGDAWADCPLFFVKWYRFWSTGGHNSNFSVGGWARQHDFYLRAFIKNRISPEETFPWFLNGERNTVYGTSDENALYQAGPLADSRYEFTNSTEGRNVGTYGLINHKDVFWLDDSTFSSANFMCCPFTNIMGWDSETDVTNPRQRQSDWDWEYGYFFDDALTRLQEFVTTEIDAIYQLFLDNQESEENANSLQRTLAEKALSALGWRGGGSVDLLKNHILSLYEGIAYEEPCLYTIVKVNEEDSDELTTLNLSAGEKDGVIELENMMTRPFGTSNEWALKNLLEEEGVEFFDVTCPTIDTSGNLTGEMKGFVLIKVPLSIETQKISVLEAAREMNDLLRRRVENSNNLDRYQDGIIGKTYCVTQEVYTLLKDLQSFKYAKSQLPARFLGKHGLTDLKFNFSNILAEFRNGSEYQEPLNYFRTVFIDHLYNRELFGPFNASKQSQLIVGQNHSRPEVKGSYQYAPQRLSMNAEMLNRPAVLLEGADNYNLQVDVNGLPLKEGSDDQRVDNADDLLNYSNWANRSLANWDEDAVPVVHTVYNPNVTRAFVSLNISALNDTLTYKHKPEAADDPLDIASKFPAVLNIKVETGTLGLNSDGSEGLQTPYKTYTYRIVALIEGNTIIDIGNPDYRGDSTREFIVNLDGGDPNINAGFELPPTINNKQVILSANGEQGIEAGTIDQDSTEKRYVKITKLSYETNSVLINKVVQLGKVTEIIDVSLPYPFSAIVGTRLDSRSFTSIPRRSFDCKLKKVKVPSNYFPISKTKLDKRYYNSQAAFDNTDKKDRQVYKGDWDGSLKEQPEWTDNPAWILYDLLTNQRYGMGSHININEINIWELYRIGRFCDAVDDDGYFEGVTDGRGGKEPRFSCNIVFEQGQKIFDAINTIAAIFRGRVFFSNSSINFVDDRPREPVNIFTNENVKDGLFFYSNNRRDEQFNVIEVGFKDRFDNFSPKIEVVEDEDSIKEKGIFKKRIEGVGITSRAMARRVAQHQIFSKIKENQQVAFTAGLETLLCQPGDLVFIEDDLKTNKANFGKVLDVDLEKEIIRVSNTYSSSEMNPVLTVMNPTGADGFDEIETGFATLKRQRYQEFTVTGENIDVAWARYTGVYNFSGYTDGYTGATQPLDPRYKQYALYTGIPSSGTMLYFETGVTGWVFASGTQALNLFSGDFISESTGDQTLAAMGTGKIAEFDFTAENRRGTLHSFEGFDSEAYIGAGSRPTHGVLTSELEGLKPEQLTVLNVTTILANEDQLTGAGYNNYGSVLSGFDRPEVLPFIKLGSSTKLEIKDASPFIYKVVSMKGERTNEYLVTATKYETGKFELIEDNISIENEADTFSYQKCQTINKIVYCPLDAPVINSVISGVPDATTDTFSITGNWSAVANSSGYGVELVHPNGITESTSVTTTGHQFSDLAQVGVFNYRVNALGNNAKADGANAYFDSDYDSSGIFVVYDDLLTFSKSFVDQIQIL